MTRSLVASETSERSFSALDMVDRETPTLLARSIIVTVMLAIGRFSQRSNSKLAVEIDFENATLV